MTQVYRGGCPRLELANPSRASISPQVRYEEAKQVGSSLVTRCKVPTSAGGKGAVATGEVSGHPRFSRFRLSDIRGAMNHVAFCEGAIKPCSTQKRSR
jgi:hypothetical protein